MPAPTNAAPSAALSDADGVILVMERPTLTAELERFCPYQQSIDYLRRYCAFWSAGERNAILAATADLIGIIV